MAPPRNRRPPSRSQLDRGTRSSARSNRGSRSNHGAGSSHLAQLGGVLLLSCTAAAIACSGPSEVGDGMGGSGTGAGSAVGGATSTGGGGPVTGGAGGASPDEVSCDITVTSSTTAEAIPTVGIIELSTDLPGFEGGTIQFGVDESYGMEAPIDRAAANNRTLLLGLAAGTTYHYRIAARAGSQVCYSSDQTIQSGGLVAGGPSNLIPQMGPSSAPVAPGFIVTSGGSAGAGSSFGYVFDKAGQIVWAFGFGGQSGFNSGITRMRMSWDGKYMFARDLGPFDAGSGGTIYRVSLDGTGLMTLPVAGGHHHDFTVTPDGIAYIAKLSTGECDHIMLAGPDGSDSRSIIDLWDVLQYFPSAGGGAEKCHVNAINYSADGDFFTISDREKDVIVKVSRQGEVLATYGQTPSTTLLHHVTAEGAGTKWRVQHGHHHYADDKLLVFSNGPFQNGTSRVLHYTITGTQAALDWEYSGMGSSPTMSNALTLPGGNFLAVRSQGGTIDELDANHERIRRWEGGSFGYAFHRTTLYGPPPSR